MCVGIDGAAIWRVRGVFVGRNPVNTSNRGRFRFNLLTTSSSWSDNTGEAGEGKGQPSSAATTFQCLPSCFLNHGHLKNLIKLLSRLKPDCRGKELLGASSVKREAGGKRLLSSRMFGVLRLGFDVDLPIKIKVSIFKSLGNKFKIFWIKQESLFFLFGGYDWQKIWPFV